VSGDCCSATCQVESTGSSCEADGIQCTVDACDGNGVCVRGGTNDALCSDGSFCNGDERCRAGEGCESGTPPVVSDGVSCTTDSCDEEEQRVVHVAVDSFCDDEQFCDGVEICDPLLDCRPGTPPNVSDGVACTVDSCDEVSDSIVNAPNDLLCSTNQRCDGELGCVASCDAQAGDPCDTGQLGVCAAGVIQCPSGSGGEPVCVAVTGPSLDLCFDAIDQDCSGTADDDSRCRVRTFDLPDWAEDVELSSNGLAYVPIQSHGLRILGIDEGLQPFEVGRFDPGSCVRDDKKRTFFADDVELGGVEEDDRAYIAAGRCGLWILDVTFPANPTVVAEVALPGHAEDVRLLGNLALVAIHKRGLQIVDIRDERNPRVLSQLGGKGSDVSFGAAIDVEVFGNIAYVAAGKGLFAIDLGEDASDPQVLGMFPISREEKHPQDVAIARIGDGLVAFLSVWTDGVRILDVSDPTRMTELARIKTQGAAEEVKLVDGVRLFVSSGKAGIEQFDVSALAKPVAVPMARTDGHAWALEILPNGIGYNAFGRLGKRRPDGTYDKTGGLQVFDLTLLYPDS
jgi:hypothetical protein